MLEREYQGLLTLLSAYAGPSLSQTEMSSEDAEKYSVAMKGEEEDPSDRVVSVQFTKPPEVVAKTAIVLDKYGHNMEARLLRGW